MGRFTVGAKLDFSAAPVTNWDYDNITDAKVVVSSGDFRVIIRGDFTEGASGNLRGTVNKFIVEEDGVEQFRGEQLNLDGFDFFQALEAEDKDPFAIWSEVTSRGDSFYGGLGNDTMDLGARTDTAWGAEGSDFMTGRGGADRMYGGADNDYLYGGASQDTLFGGAGIDIVDGGTGADTLFGGRGNDNIYGGSELDTAYGGRGVDAIYGGSGISSLYGGGGNDYLYSGDKADHLFGGDHDDFLFSGSGADTMFGGSGRDAFYGGLGTDTMFGGRGDDYFAPNTGRTVITGGRGADDFQFDTQAGHTTIIKDFGRGNDLLVLAELLVGEDLSGQQIYNRYGSTSDGHTFFHIGELVIRLNNYTTSTAGWGEDILTY